MSRPLLVTDCDEVLLHMVRHFRDWLDAEHEIEFELAGNPFVQSMTRRGSDAPLEEKEVWALLGGFFDTQMGVQVPVEGAVEAMAEIGQDADVVVLTNLTDERNEARKAQLKALGIDVPVFTNQGPKGEALRQIVAEHGASRAVFVDDLAVHHKSAAKEAPDVYRLHFCGESAIAPHIPCAHDAGHAHARLDNWAEALPWVLDTLHGDRKTGES